MIHTESRLWDNGTIENTKQVLAQESTLKIAQNQPFDILRLKRYGVVVKGPLWDIMIAQQLLDPDGIGFSLEEMASYWLDLHRWKHKGNPGSRPKEPKLKLWKRDFVCAECTSFTKTGTGTRGDRICARCTNASFERLLEEWRRDLAIYNRWDVLVPLLIQPLQEREMRRRNLLALMRKTMRVYENVLIPMMERGVRVDLEEARKLVEWETKKATHALENWKRLTGGVDPLSWQQLRVLLYEEWKLKKQFTKAGALTTNEEAIHQLRKLAPLRAQRKALSALLRFKKAFKRVSLYTGMSQRIYPLYSPATKDTARGAKKYAAIASTGRILAKGDPSTHTPGIQQVTKRVRRTILPEEGHLVVQVDYASQELYLIAYISGDKKLISMLERGEDIHGHNSKAFGVDRTRAKNMFYGGAAYGAGARAVLSALRARGYDLPIKTIEEFIAYCKREYQGLARWQRVVVGEARSNRLLRTPILGRLRYFFDVSRQYNEAINFKIQGSGSDIQIDRLEEMELMAAFHGGYLMLANHDGFVFSIPKGNVGRFKEDIRVVMEKVYPEIAPGFFIPVDIEVGENWGELS